jgi:hypothetical protein
MTINQTSLEPTTDVRAVLESFPRVVSIPGPQVTLPDGRVVTAHDRALAVRLDNGQCVGDVGDGYVVHNLGDPEMVAITQAFLDGSGARITGTWERDGGRQMGLTAELPGIPRSQASVGDTIKTLVRIGTGFDGSLATFAMLEALNLACLNGMTVNVPDADRCLQVKHTAHSKDRLVEGARMARRMVAYQTALVAKLDSLTSIRFSEAMAGATFRQYLGIAADAVGDDIPKQRAGRLDSLVGMYANRDTLRGFDTDRAPADSAWWAWQTLTEDLTHNARVRVTDTALLSHASERLGRDINQVELGALGEGRVQAFRSAVEDNARVEANWLDGSADKSRSKAWNALWTTIDSAEPSIVSYPTV